VYRCPSYEKLDHLLDVLNSDIKEMNSKLERPHEQIREHCNELRNQIDIATETLIESINKFREQYINEVNLFEENCSKSFKCIENRDEIYKILKENEFQIQKLKNYVNKPKVNEDEVRGLIQKCKIQEYELKNQLKIIDGNLFGSQKPYFEKINKFVDPAIIGRINYESLIVLNDLINIEKIVNPKIEKVIEHSNVDMALPLVTFNGSDTNENSYDEKFLVLSGHYLKIINDYHTLVEINFDHQPDYVSVNRIEPAILVQHFRNTWRNSRKEKANYHTLSVYDYNLNLNYESALETGILSIAHNDTNIFVQHADKKTICIYSWFLEKV